MHLVILFFILVSSSSLLCQESPNERMKVMLESYTNKNVKVPLNFNKSQKLFSNSLPNAVEGFYAKGEQTSSQTWMHAGPNDVGGRTRTVQYDRTNPDIVITGGVSGGIWRSIDGGKSWVQVTGKNEIASVTSIIQDPRPGNNNIWYCAGGEYDGNSASEYYSARYTGNGILKSTDNGMTWHPYGTTADNRPEHRRGIDQVYRLVLDPNILDEDILYAACAGAILRVTENGNNRESALDIDSLDFYNLATDILITPDGKYYATLSYESMYLESTSHSGIFYSEDGYTWENISPESLQPSYRIVMDYAPSDNNILYFLCSNITELSTGCKEGYEQCNSIFKLKVNEENFEWTDLSQNLPFFEAIHKLNYLLTHMSYCSALKISPIDPNIVLIAGANCFISYDGFTSTDKTQWIAGYNPNWNAKIFSDTTLTMQQRYLHLLQSHFPTGGWDFHWFEFNPNNPNELLSASDHGIHKLPDISESSKKEWIDMNNGFCTTQFFDCAIDRYTSGSDDIIGGMQDNNTMGNLINNNHFNKIFPGDGMACYITKSGSIVISSQNANILRVDLNNGIPYNGTYVMPVNLNNLSPLFRTIFSVNKTNEKEIAIPTNSAIAICRDLTKGDTHNYFDIHMIDNLNARSVEYTSYPNNHLLVGTADRRIFKVTDLSKDNFKYEILELPEYVTGDYVSDIWVNHADNNHFIAIVSNYLTLGMLETTDGGITWTDHGGNLEENPDGTGSGHSFRCYERMIYEGDTLHLLGTSDGLFSTKKLQGENTVWMREGANTIGKAVIEDIEVRDLDGRIVIATHGNGLFKTNYTTSVNDFDGNNLGFAVSEVFPNPASDQISFVINADNITSIEAKLLDPNGQEIATLISNKFAGTRTIEYNCKNISSGTYFLHITDGKNYTTRKVNVIR